MNAVLNVIFQFGTQVVLFLVMVYIGSFILDKIKNNPNRVLNPKEYLPEDELHTLKQVFYLVMMALSFIDIFYSFISIDLFYFIIFDVLVSLLIAIPLDKSSLKNKILLLLLVPYGSLTFLLFGIELVMLLDIVHVLIFIYFIKYYYDKFMIYTELHGLGITIILLFSIIFISFFATQINESKSPLDALVMVSNAFTSNGYAVLGHSVLGKVNSIFLVWGGYIISGAGTASLTAAILLRHFNKRFRELEKLIEEGDEE